LTLATLLSHPTPGLAMKAAHAAVHALRLEDTRRQQAQSHARAQER
jgi:hypothetical protein